MVKVKQDDYLALHRIMFGMSEKVVWRHLAVHALGGTVIKDSKHWGQLLGIGPEEAETELSKGEEWLEEALYKGDFPDEVVSWFESTKKDLVDEAHKLYARGLTLGAHIRGLDARSQYEEAKHDPLVKEILVYARTGDASPLWARCWRELQPVGQSNIFSRNEEVA